MDVIESPTVGSSIDDIRDAYAGDGGLLAITHVSGTLALVAYVVFALELFALLRARADESVRFGALAGLVGAVLGVAVAAVGVLASSVLVLERDALGSDTTRALFEVTIVSRELTGAFVALTFAGFGWAALHGGALPPPLGVSALALAVVFVAAPLAAFTTEHWPHTSVAAAFGGQALWIAATSLWLLVAEHDGAVGLLRRGAFLLVAVAAGAVGLGLLLFPESTPTFFSWGLRPPALAALAGGLYVGAAAAFALGLRASWPAARTLAIGGVVLSASVLSATLIHLDQFSFHRIQTWAWVVLFIGFTFAFAAILLVHRGGEEHAPVPLSAVTRWSLAALALLLFALGSGLWVDPLWASGPSPIDLAPLGGRFIGSWVWMLAVMCGWAALRDRAAEARPALVMLAGLALGALLAALRTLGDLEPARAAVVYVAAAAALAAGTLAMLRGVGGLRG
jgi:hypothetical protein